MSPELIIDLKCIGICAVIAYGSTESLKPLLKTGPKRLALVRSLALVSGAIAGYFIYPELDGKMSAIVGLGLGASSGALNALLVAQIKNRIKKADENGTN